MNENEIKRTFILEKSVLEHLKYVKKNGIKQNWLVNRILKVILENGLESAFLSKDPIEELRLKLCEGKRSVKQRQEEDEGFLKL